MSTARARPLPVVMGMHILASAMQAITRLLHCSALFSVQAVAADVGNTLNSSVTFDHMLASNADLVMLVGDLTYAVGGSCGRCCTEP